MARQAEADRVWAAGQALTLDQAVALACGRAPGAGERAAGAATQHFGGRHSTPATFLAADPLFLASSDGFERAFEGGRCTGYSFEPPELVWSPVARCTPSSPLGLSLHGAPLTPLPPPLPAPYLVTVSNPPAYGSVTRSSRTCTSSCRSLWQRRDGAFRAHRACAATALVGRKQVLSEQQAEGAGAGQHPCVGVAARYWYHRNTQVVTVMTTSAEARGLVHRLAAASGGVGRSLRCAAVPSRADAPTERRRNPSDLRGLGRDRDGTASAGRSAAAAG